MHLHSVLNHLFARLEVNMVARHLSCHEAQAWRRVNEVLDADHIVDAAVVIGPFGCRLAINHRLRRSQAQL